MKKFLIDQILFMVIGVIIMAIIPFFCGPIFTFIFEILLILCWGYLCRRILWLPIDCILGKVSQTVYFSSQCGVEDLEFIRTTKYCVWKFYFGNDQTLKLLVPMAIKKEGICNVDRPQKDDKLRITYYRFSKILLQWDSF